jgi:hypothetical protein
MVVVDYVVGTQHEMVHLSPLLADVDIEPTLSTVRQQLLASQWTP